MASSSNQPKQPQQHESAAFSRLMGDSSSGFPARVRRSVLFRWLAFAVTIGVLVFFFPHSTDVEQSREPGSIWSGDTVRATTSFPLYKDEQLYEQEITQARDSVLPIFSPTGMDFTRLRDTLRNIALRLDSLDFSTVALPEKSGVWIRSLPDESRRAQLTRIVDALIAGLQTPSEAGVIDRLKSSIRKERIVLRRGTAFEEELPVKSLYDSLQVMQMLDAALASRKIDENAYGVALDLFRAVWQPSYRYNSILTEEAQQIAANAVPKTQGLVREGQVIVTSGEEITEQTALMLQSYERSRRLRRDVGSRWLQMGGNLGHVMILLGLPLIYLYNFRPRIFRDNLQVGIILSIVLLIGLLAWLSIAISTPLPIEYLILVPFLSMLLAILFDSRTAFYLTVVCCLIVAGIRGADYSVALALLSAGVMAAYTVRDIKNRTQLFRSIAFSSLGFAVAVVSLGLERGDTFEAIGVQLGFAGINAIVSPVLTFAAILVLERLFTITTDLKLLEYDDLNHPLLRLLADKAPGTYQHTLTIARLAESAANAVGANALQAKVGAYFHDVGKIARAEYFVENQMGMANKHDRIKPEQSVKVIREHVFDGMKIARQYGLPERIVDFIPTHHGTTTIKYFFDKAREENPNVDPDLFRYPGPRPYSRETAIVMLADAVEATARSLSTPNAKSISEAVDQIIKRRFADGQLDECDLTLADLTKIREAFVKNLVGMAHPRVQYKKDEDEGAKQGDAKKSMLDIRHVEDAFGRIEPKSGEQPK